jgi:hypothetical protein
VATYFTDVSPNIFLAQNIPIEGNTILVTITGTTLTVLINQLNTNIDKYPFPLSITGTSLVPSTNIISGSGTTFTVDQYYPSTVVSNINLYPQGAIAFIGSIVSNTLRVTNATLVSMVIPFTISSQAFPNPLTVTQANPVTYTLSKTQPQPLTGTFTGTRIGGLSTSINRLGPVLDSVDSNRYSIDVCLSYFPEFMQVCDDITYGCIQAYSYYYTTLAPSDAATFSTLGSLQTKYTSTVQYTNNGYAAPTLFWIGDLPEDQSPVFSPYSGTYTCVKSGQVNGVAVNGATIVIVGIFYADYYRTLYLGTMMVSSDSGETWSLPFDPGHVVGDYNVYLANAVIYTGYVWVATGRWATGSISISSDGKYWNAPVNPLNDTGTGSSLATSSSGLILGGSWTKGSITVASGNAIQFTWGQIVRPTNLLLNNVAVNKIDTLQGVYLALGQWLTITQQYIASIYYSTDFIQWSPATLNNSVTSAITYSVCSDSSRWVALGNFQGAAGSLGSIMVSSAMSGSSWPDAPIGPGGLTTGTGYDCIYASKLFFYVGSWSSGVLAITNSTYECPPAIQLTGSTGGTAYSISAAGTTYLIGGSFQRTSGGYGTLSVISDVSVALPTFSCVTTVPFSPGSVNTNSPLSVCRGIAVNSSIYVAVGLWVMIGSPNASISVSYDGVNWQAPINPGPSGSPSLGQGLSVKWNGAEFIATGQWATGSVSVSIDGLTWSTPIHPPNVSSGPSTSASWNSTTQNWLLAGNWIDATTSPLGNITSFFYGITFSKPFHPGSSTSGVTTGITWDPTQSTWISVGSWTDGVNTGYETKSLNGTTWSNPFTPNGISFTGAQLRTVANVSVTPTTTLSLLGGNFTFKPSPIQQSIDGKTWVSKTTGNGIEGTAKGIAWINSTWYMLGSFRRTVWGQETRGPMLLSKDGNTWNTIMEIPLTDPLVVAAVNTIILPPTDVFTYYIDSTMNSVAYNGSVFVATGSIRVQPIINGTQSDPIFIGTNLYSTDGSTWSIQLPQLNSILLEGSVGNSIVWNGSLFVLAGNWINEYGTSIAFLLYSADGIRWSITNGLSGVSGVAKSIAWNGYTWVAGGLWLLADGSFAILTRSTDGITWTSPIDPTATPLTSKQVSSITWNGTLFSAVGTTDSSSLTLRSRDGITWTFTSPALVSLPISVGSLPVEPFLLGQPFDPSIVLSKPTITLPNQQGYVLEWSTNATYGAGTQYSLNLTNATVTFTASQRTQWLSFGSYYSATDTIQFTLNNTSTLKIPFVTDLVGPYFSWTNSLGHALIDTVSLSIGGETVETIPGQLMEILDEFQTPLEKVDQMSKLICRAENGFGQETFGLDSTSQTVVTPLPFWFSRGDPGCALPIDALNVDEVRLTVNFRPITSLYYTDSRAAVPAAVEGGSLWPIAGSPFYYQDASGTLIPGLEPNQSAGKVLPFPNLNMTTALGMPNSYLLVEYIYLDKAEANRFRIADLQVPIVQHYTIDPVDTTKNTYVKIPLEIPNPARDIFFYCQRYEAPGLNAHFLASRDISSYKTPGVLWWPDATGLYTSPKPGFSTRDSEPIRWLALNYAGTLNRYTTENVALFRSLLPAVEQRKAPWVNRYYYNLPFGSQNGLTPFSMPVGEANLDKIRRFNLSLGFHGTSDLINDDIVDRYIIRVYGETYNIFRVYGGRGSMMFAY